MSVRPYRDILRRKSRQIRVGQSFQSSEYTPPSVFPLLDDLGALGRRSHKFSIAIAGGAFAVGIRKLQREGKITRAMVVDCDNHHGNGTAAIFAGDPTVFTLSIHQYNNYPARKPSSTVDVHLSDGVNDEEYLERLSAAYRFPLHGFHPELLVYVAGADPYREDQLGGLALTLEGLKRRDRLVIETALREGAAVAIVLAGGYAVQLEDTVSIHSNTAKVAKEALEAAGWGKK